MPLTRREFLKSMGVFAASTAIRTAPHLQILKNKLTALRYINIDFESNGRIMTPDLFETQMNYLKQRDYKTLTDKELVAFLHGNYIPPINTTILRFDNGNFSEIVPIIREKGHHGIFFINPHSVENWSNLASCYNEGLISIGLTNSLEYVISNIEYKMKSSGARNFKILGSTNPDSRMKFSFGKQERKIDDNYIKLNNPFQLPSITPYVYSNWVSNASLYAKSNPLVWPIAVKDGWFLSFGETLALNETTVTIDNIVNPEKTSFTEQLLLPPSTYTDRLMKPGLIVMHTDGQSGNYPETWDVSRTYNALKAMGKSVHFAVDSEKSIQMIPAYKDGHGNIWFNMIPIPAIGKGGAAGVNEWAISIEMAGRDYSRGQEHLEGAIRKTSNNALTLVRKLMKELDIPVSNVVGHNEVSIYGKTDPGDKFMQSFRGYLYNQKIRIHNAH